MKRPRIGFKPVYGEFFYRDKTYYRWDGNPPREPKQGEFYLSGSKPTAYRAPDDLPTSYFIAVPVTP